MHLLYYTLAFQNQMIHRASWHFDIKWRLVAKSQSCTVMMYFAVTNSLVELVLCGIISANIVMLLNIFACSNKIYCTFKESVNTWLCYLSCWMVRLQHCVLVFHSERKLVLLTFDIYFVSVLIMVTIWKSIVDFTYSYYVGLMMWSRSMFLVDNAVSQQRRGQDGEVRGPSSRVVWLSHEIS